MLARQSQYKYLTNVRCWTIGETNVRCWTIEETHPLSPVQNIRAFMHEILFRPLLFGFSWVFPTIDLTFALWWRNDSFHCRKIIMSQGSQRGSHSPIIPLFKDNYGLHFDDRTFNLFSVHKHNFKQNCDHYHVLWYNLFPLNNILCTFSHLILRAM